MKTLKYLMLLALFSLFHESNAQPLNDDCASAQPIEFGSECVFSSYTSIDATSEPTTVAPNPTCGLYQGGDVWFSLEVPASGNFRIEMTSSGNNSQWALYSGTCGSFTQLACASSGDQLSSNFSDPALSGETLYLRAWRFNNASGIDFDICIWEMDPPANDNCAGAISLPVGASCTPQNFSSQYSTSEDVSVAPDPGCGLFNGGDVWFSFEVPASGNFRIEENALSSGFTYWSLYSGSCGSFSELLCTSMNTNFVEPGLAGETLYLRVWRYNSQQGNDFSLCVMDFDPPANDNCAGAIDLPVGTSCTPQNFSSQLSTSEDVSVAPNPGCGLYQGGDVWFSFEVPASGNFRIEESVLSSGFAYWALYSGSCGSFSELLCTSTNTNFEEPGLAGETLYLRVWRYNSQQGNDFSLCVFEIDPPVNNACANATWLTLSDECIYEDYSSQFATASPESVVDDPSCGNYQGGDVWFAFEAPTSGQFAINRNNLTSGFAYFSVYTGTCGNFTEIACDGSSAFNFNDPALGGQTLYLRFWRWSSSEGIDFEICVINTTIAANDNCADAIPLDVNTTCEVELFDNFNTTEEVGIAPNPSCGVYQGGDVWFSFEVPATGQLQINRNNISWGNYYFTVYEGTCGSFTELECSGGDPQILLDVPSLAGETLYLRLYRFNSSFGGEFELCLVAGDCNAEIGGTAFIDECGTCVGGNTGLEACVQDCNGIFGGTAFFDDCGDCVGGNTGEIACVADCNGDFGGSAFLDNCGDCVGGNTGQTACLPDCNGDFGGTAFLDNCGDCVGGETGETACLPDCNGDFGGSAFLDNCGDCVEGNTGEVACEADCNGDFGGTAFLDNCGDCVEGNTGETACLQDCNGDFGGTAFLDNCGDCVEGNTGEVACVADCNGDFGGSAFLDNCGDCVGGNTGQTACVADCNGDFGGTAFLDNCGDCVGGNTGQTACVADCNGDFGGTAYLDNCGDCVEGNTGETACAADCNGDFGGTAFLDNCGDCVGGNTGQTACVADCNGDFGGTAFLDNCGDCVEGNTGQVACEADCNGDFGGSAFLDNCGDCVGGNTGQTACLPDCNGDFGGTAFLDNCGDCVGGNTGQTACVADCNGDFGGTAFLDNCGDCVGGNTGQTACTADCNGDFGGTAFLDNCGDCVGGNTGQTACVADCNGDFGGTAFLDNCGDCVGGNTGQTACAADCNGVFGGTAYFDNCGDCVEGNTGEVACVADCNGDFGGTAFLDDCDACVGGNTGEEPCELCDLELTGSAVAANPGTPDGSASVTVTGGTEPYEYGWNDPLLQTTANATGLFAGSYVVTVTDANDCEEQLTVVVPIVSSVPNTQVADIFCNTGGYYLSDFISADGVAGADAYRWEFTDSQNNTLPEFTRTDGNKWLRLEWIADIETGETYDVRVKAQVGGMWGEYAAVCSVGITPDIPTTELRPNYSPTNAQGNAYGLCDFAMAYNISNAQNFRWTFDANGNIGDAEDIVYTRGSGNPSVRLSWVNGLIPGNIYQVGVQVEVDGSWSNYGTILPLTLALPPNDVVIRPQFCGGTYSPNGYIMSQSVCDADLYQFRFTPTGGGIPSFRNSGNYVCFMSAANPALTPGEYDVQVKVTQNGVPGDWGPACTITISSPQGQVNETPALRYTELVGSAMLFPNPNAGAEVRVQLDGLPDGNHDVNIVIYDIYGKMISSEGFGHEGNSLSRLVRFDGNLSMGMYMVQITVDGERFASERLIIK